LTEFFLIENSIYQDICVSTASFRTSRLWSSRHVRRTCMICRRWGWIWWIGNCVKYLKHFKLVIRIVLTKNRKIQIYNHQLFVLYHIVFVNN